MRPRKHGTSDPTTEMKIDPFDESQLEAVVELSLRAWEPVFESLREALSPELYYEFYGDDWRAGHGAAVEAVCRDDEVSVWVASVDSSAAGFAALKLHHEWQMGEIYMIAVDPAYQRRGIASALTRHSTDWFAQQGMSTAMVETGADPGHAPARRTYEASGFHLLPAAKYYKKL